MDNLTDNDETVRYESVIFVISPPSDEEVSAAILDVIDKVLRKYGYG